MPMPTLSRFFEPVFPILKTFIAKAGLVPYNVERRRGELKFILLTESRHNHSMMLRFVLRSEKNWRNFAKHYHGYRLNYPN